MKGAKREKLRRRVQRPPVETKGETEDRRVRTGKRAVKTPQTVRKLRRERQQRTPETVREREEVAPRAQRETS